MSRAREINHFGDPKKFAQIMFHIGQNIIPVGDVVRYQSVGVVKHTSNVVNATNYCV